MSGTINPQAEKVSGTINPGVTQFTYSAAGLLSSIEKSVEKRCCREKVSVKPGPSSEAIELNWSESATLRKGVRDN